MTTFNKTIDIPEGTTEVNIAINLSLKCSTPVGGGAGIDPATLSGSQVIMDFDAASRITFATGNASTGGEMGAYDNISDSGLTITATEALARHNWLPANTGRNNTPYGAAVWDGGQSFDHIDPSSTITPKTFIVVMQLGDGSSYTQLSNVDAAYSGPRTQAIIAGAAANNAARFEDFRWANDADSVSYVTGGASVRVNGVAKTAAQSLTDVLQSGPFVSVLRNASATKTVTRLLSYGNPWLGPVLYMASFNRALTDEETTGVEEFLANKFSLTLA